jgi:hypothetical protein
MVNHRGSASPMSIDYEARQIRDSENSSITAESADLNAMAIDTVQVSSDRISNALLTPPATDEVDDLPAIFDLPPDAIHASVHELPRKDGSSFTQLPMYGPPVLSEEPYHNPIEDWPIVPISRYCLERHVVTCKTWEPLNKNYRQSTPEEAAEMSAISREVQVEAIPSFAPAATGTSSRATKLIQNCQRIHVVVRRRFLFVLRCCQQFGSIQNRLPGLLKKNANCSRLQRTVCTISI